MSSRAGDVFNALQMEAPRAASEWRQTLDLADYRLAREAPHRRRDSEQERGV